jgi:hypothetical protein
LWLDHENQIGLWFGNTHEGWQHEAERDERQIRDDQVDGLADLVRLQRPGVDPLDHNGILARATELGLTSDERGWLIGLFSPTQAITVLRDSGQFTNGMHRTHALRMAGVERCVVYTGRGELPHDGE